MPWTCPTCDHANAADALVCDTCGVARRWHEDPPLDIPPAPPWTHVGPFWAALLYGGLAAAGGLALLRPGWLASLGIGVPWIALEVLIAGAAFGGALVETVWQRRFNRADLRVPATVRAGQRMEATLTLVPYVRLDAVDVRLELVERTYEQVMRRGRRQTRTRSRVLERTVLQRGAPLAARREHDFVAADDAPPPSLAHHDVGSELAASAMAAFAPLVPGLGHHARNLREHGGIFVRAVVRFGVWRRVYEQRVTPVVVPIGRPG